MAEPVNIDVAYLLDKLEALLRIPSPTGYTDSVVRWLCEELTRLDISFELTRRGAVRARIPGAQFHGARAFVSHVDTLGALVKQLKENGRLELTPIGTWSARFAEGARATVFTETGAFRGTILPHKASGHTFGDEIDTAPIGWQQVELRIDALARDLDDLRALGVEIGDFVSIDPQPEFLDNGFVVSRHLDNKGGVAAMLAAMKAMKDAPTPPVDVYWLFTIAEEVGHGAASILPQNVAAMVTVDNGTSAPGQNSSEFGVTIGMGDETGPFDYHLTRRLVQLCKQHGVSYRKDVFRYYRSDSASALEAGADVRTALMTFGIDASHGYERIHAHALRSCAALMVLYAIAEVTIPRDEMLVGDLRGFTRQPTAPAEQELSPESAVESAE
ncbi:MAG: osmoprotectant NAGGN system M42 family peptidase [Pseudomonadota bacterium]